MLEQLPNVDLVLSPVSGGGLLSGVSTAIKLSAAPSSNSIHSGQEHRPEGDRLQSVRSTQQQSGGFSRGGSDSSPIQIFGCEPELAADAHASFTTRTLTEWPAELTSRTLCDGLRTQSLGALNFDHILRFTDGILTVTEAEIRTATRIILQATKLTAEPSGAITLAAALFHTHQLPPARKIVAILSGGNLDPTLRTELLNQNEPMSA
ncbi:MAG: pyridoxal-phosphate dependent enzyme [Acidobacteria bacterium]|nr:pyridoxal-phosphate dependent enzyme [Acidobacteriota bacterium]